MTPVWWLLAFVPLLIALYFLKLKRQQVTVSSTLLWKRSLEDLHVNAPFQRLRRSLLLLLQLLALLLLITAAWRPRCNYVETSGRNLLVFIDNSASMNAVEKDGSRLDLAKGEALRLVDSMGDTDRMMVMAFASRTVTLQPLSSDRALLEAKIRSLGPTSLPTNLVAALTNASSFAQDLTTAEIYILGDGCYGDLSELPAEVKRLSLRFPGKATALDNAGITEADVRRTFGSEPRTEVFVLVRNYSKVERRLTLSLFHEEQLIDARPLTIAPGEANPATFVVTELSPGMVRVEIDGDDALSDDDRVYLENSPPPRVSAVVVGEENQWLDWALRSNDYIAHSRVSREAMASEEMRKLLEGSEPPVVIFDRWIPDPLPAVPAIFIGCHPPLPEGFAEPKAAERPVIIDWDRGHPVNRFLVFNEVRIAKGLVFGEPNSEHFRSLVDTDLGSIVGVFTRQKDSGGSVPALIVGFNILESDWFIRHHSFPIFFTNALNWLGTSIGELKARWRTGEPLVYQVSRGEREEPPSQIEFRTPDGRLFPGVLEKGGSVVFGKVDQVGVYELLVDSELEQRFGVGLVNERESNLEPADKIDFGSFTVPAQTESVEESRDLWFWFALAALAFLLLEWYIYHRRVYI